MSLIVHPQCGKAWSGLRREHCPACHETFNSSFAADKHRKGEHGVNRHCITPAQAGLLAVQYEWGTVWQTPGTYRGQR